MPKDLVLVESPAKAKTINKYLGKDFVVEATVGHIKNLPKSNLGVEVDKGFLPKFVTIRGKGDIIKKIKDLAGKSKNIYIATDPDREGEAIAQDIADVIDVKKGTGVHRVLFNEITKNGVLRGMAEPRQIDFHLVASQRARRVMDRIIGYKISPFLWKVVLDGTSNNLSAGRVQSVALRLVCEREVEIENFIAIEHWSIWGHFRTEKGELFKAKLVSIGGKEIKFPHKANLTDEEVREFTQQYVRIANRDDAQAIFDRIRLVQNFAISNIYKRTIRRNAPAPFITSSLQAEASKALRFRSKQTMAIAQKLYEGVDLGKEGTAGLITYMRTDSTRLSPEIVDECRGYIKDTFGAEYVPASPNSHEKKKKGANVQDAHEAIRPTSLKYSPEFVKPFLDENAFKLYTLIWNRFVACQMNPAVLETTVVEVLGNEFLFKALGQAVKFDGYTRLYIEQQETVEKDDEKEEGRNEMLPVGMEKGNPLGLNDLSETQHFTKAPPRYTESSLIKELESKGIGRPSTYAMIVSTIVDRLYAEMRERKLYPTELGKKINGILVDNFPNIIDAGFTSRMEEELDQIAQGDLEYLRVLEDFYNPFSTALRDVEGKIEKIICEKCGGEMSMKFSRFGRFLGCNNYPDCKNIKSLKEFGGSAEPEYTGETCEKCGNRTVFRRGKFGKFIGCEKYPDCDFVKNIVLNIKCPKCKDGDVVERMSRRKKVFYGCSRYPDCDFAAWSKPAPVACPNGDSLYMEEKWTQKKGNFLKCPVCGHENVEEQVAEEEI